MELDSLQRGMLLSDLPGTQTEVDLISDNLKSKSWDVEVITGIDATETRVKSIEAPKILHIATHGFFFEDLEMVKRSNMISTDNKKAIANPMTRSGLIFSGAENTMNGEILAGDNGWLNSSEVSLLNLRGTELVVLSACEDRHRRCSKWERSLWLTKSNKSSWSRIIDNEYVGSR